MQELLIADDDFGPLREAAQVPRELELDGCDLVVHPPPRALAGLDELCITGGRVSSEALARWLEACPDLGVVELHGLELGSLSWSMLPARLQELLVGACRLVELRDPRTTGGLRRIELTSCGLERVDLPTSLPSLEAISLAYNRTLGRCPDLPWSARSFSLDLRGCGLAAWPEVAGVEKVRSLELSFNTLAAVPAELAGWCSLETLRLQECGLTELVLPPGELPLLRTLYLTGNPLAAWPEGLVALPELRVVDLTDCGLVGLPGQIGDARRLEVLQLARNHVPSVPDSIVQLAKLRTLGLWKTGLARLPDSLSGLAGLRQLDLGYNPLSALPDLGELPELGFLGLCGLTRLDWEQAWGRLAELRRVGQISFSNSPLGRFDRRVMSIPGLQRLDVNGTGVDPAVWEELRREFPQVTIWGG